jgi:glycosyltransferase involved in cell wall biosynthesis
MKIAITAEHANLDELTGVEHYTRQLILALARIDHKNEYVLYFRTPPKEWCSGLPPNFSFRVMPAPFAWTQVRVAWEILRNRPDALLITSFSMPLVHPRNSVVTIHDLAWQLFPESINLKQKLWLVVTHQFATRFAKHLIAVSEQTKQDIVSLLKVPGSKIEVIHHGFSPHEALTGSRGEAAARLSVTNKCELSKSQSPFILCLGTLQPRKNLIRMIDAFCAFKEQTKLPHRLVLAGRAGWMCQDVLDKARITPDVVYLGYVKDRLALLRSAELLVQPAIYEGFGLSLLDAFSQNVPVACSDVSSLPEIAGDAAELFDPYSVESITEAMINVLTFPERAEELRLYGARRLQSFTWEGCAKKTLEVVEGSRLGATSVDAYLTKEQDNPLCLQ